jgi:hypothetical protein
MLANGHLVAHKSLPKKINAHEHINAECTMRKKKKKKKQRKVFGFRISPDTLPARSGGLLELIATSFQDLRCSKKTFSR